MNQILPQVEAAMSVFLNCTVVKKVNSVVKNASWHLSVGVGQGKMTLPQTNGVLD